MLRDARLGLALLIVVGACALSALAPASANAFVSYYNCVLKPSNQWCDGRANGSFDGLHSWDYNYGWYPGTWDDSVYVCERVWRPSTGFVLGDSCSYNWTEHIYGNITCVCYEANVKQISGGPHSINGLADADYP